MFRILAGGRRWDIDGAHHQKMGGREMEIKFHRAELKEERGERRETDGLKKGKKGGFGHFILIR